MKETLGERIIKQKGVLTVKEVFYKEEIAGARRVQGLTGEEWVLIKTEIRPNHIYNIIKK
jgi:hypothetical protein